MRKGGCVARRGGCHVAGRGGRGFYWWRGREWCCGNSQGASRQVLFVLSLRLVGVERGVILGEREKRRSFKQTLFFSPVCFGSSKAKVVFRNNCAMRSVFTPIINSGHNVLYNFSDMKVSIICTTGTIYVFSLDHRCGHHALTKI